MGKKNRSGGTRPIVNRAKFEVIGRGHFKATRGARTLVLQKGANGRLNARHRDGKSSEEVTHEEDVQMEELSMAIEENTDMDPPPADAHPRRRKDLRRRTDKRNGDKAAQWLLLRDTFLDELLRHDGLVDSTSTTKCRCGVSDADIRCKDCAVSNLLCSTCIAVDHGCLPLHRLEKWNGAFFSKTTLKAAGATVQLGHSGSCLHPSSPRSIRVYHANGIHDINVQFCECVSLSEGIAYQWIQLLRARWFPSSTGRPQTVFTFDVLELFHELNLQGKTNMYDFYWAIVHLTDNSGKSAHAARYKQFTHVIRVWRHLKMLKRAGRGHCEEGAISTRAGQLAIECPACPHPGRNLPDGWENNSERWLYQLFLQMDANFRLRSKDRGIDDTTMSPGWGFLVNSDEYDAHELKFAHWKDENKCTAEHDAIVKANLRKEGYLASGVAAVMCRHALIQPNGAANLHKGEKFCDMDFPLLKVLVQHSAGIKDVFISYDISCQYSRNFVKRMKEYPDDLRLDLDNTTIRWGIPKKHFPVHGPNHSQYSLNFLPHVGRFYGEGIESGWNWMNPLSNSSQEMSPATRHELLDDHWSAMNHQKILDFGPYFVRRFEEATSMKAKQRAVFDDYSATFPQEIVCKWTAQVDKWDMNPASEPDLYEEPAAGTTLNTVRLELAKRDTEDLAAGSAVHLHEISPSGFIHEGIQLEEHIRTLLMPTVDHSERQRAETQEKRNILVRRIKTWRVAQDLYMPVVSQLRLESEGPSAASKPVPVNVSKTAGDGSSPSTPDNPVSSPSSPPPELTLWMPSGVPVRYRNNDIMRDLMDKEKAFRVGQADDALTAIRHLRRVLVGVRQFRDLNVAGTGNANMTRMRSLYSRFNLKIRRAVLRYRAARDALESLDPNGDWERRFKILKDSDVSGPGQDHGASEGRYVPSWIWLVPRADGSSVDSDDLNVEEFSNSMRVEWARSKARAERWAEEVSLIEEEMRRTIIFLRWKATWWKTQADNRKDEEAALVSGLRAYAAKQASILEVLAERFAGLWIPVLFKSSSLPDWHTLYPAITPAVPAPEENERADAEESEAALEGEDDTDEEL